MIKTAVHLHDLAVNDTKNFHKESVRPIFHFLYNYAKSNRFTNIHKKVEKQHRLKSYWICEQPEKNEVAELTSLSEFKQKERQLTINLKFQLKLLTSES